MKRVIVLAIISTIFATCGFQANAQDNEIGLNLMPLGLGSANISYERALAPQHSLKLGLTYRIPFSTPFTSTIQDLIDQTGVVESNKFSGFSVTPEYRFYTSSDAEMDGFYVAPYLKYNTYSAEIEYKTPEDFNQNISLDYSSFGGGVGIGYKWVLSDVVCLDYYIAGFGVAKNNVTYRYENSDPGENYETSAKDLATSINDFPLIGGNLVENPEDLEGNNVAITYGELEGEPGGFNEAAGDFIFGGFRTALVLTFRF